MREACAGLSWNSHVIKSEDEIMVRAPGWFVGTQDPPGPKQAGPPKAHDAVSAHQTVELLQMFLESVHPLLDLSLKSSSSSSQSSKQQPGSPEGQNLQLLGSSQRNQGLLGVGEVGCWC